jgi:hypothetical protein
MGQAVSKPLWSQFCGLLATSSRPAGTQTANLLKRSFEMALGEIAG